MGMDNNELGFASFSPPPCPVHGNSPGSALLFAQTSPLSSSNKKGTSHRNLSSNPYKRVRELLLQGDDDDDDAFKKWTPRTLRKELGLRIDEDSDDEVDAAHGRDVRFQSAAAFLVMNPEQVPEYKNFLNVNKSNMLKHSQSQSNEEYLHFSSPSPHARSSHNSTMSNLQNFASKPVWKAAKRDGGSGGKAGEMASLYKTNKAHSDRLLASSLFKKLVKDCGLKRKIENGKEILVPDYVLFQRKRKMRTTPGEKEQEEVNADVNESILKSRFEDNLLSLQGLPDLSITLQNSFKETLNELEKANHTGTPIQSLFANLDLVNMSIENLNNLIPPSKNAIVVHNANKNIQNSIVNEPKRKSKAPDSVKDLFTCEGQNANTRPSPNSTNNACMDLAVRNVSRRGTKTDVGSEPLSQLFLQAQYHNVYGGKSAVGDTQSPHVKVVGKDVISIAPSDSRVSSEDKLRQYQLLLAKKKQDVAELTVMKSLHGGSGATAIIPGLSNNEARSWSPDVLRQWDESIAQYRLENADGGGVCDWKKVFKPNEIGDDGEGVLEQNKENNGNAGTVQSNSQNSDQYDVDNASFEVNESRTGIADQTISSDKTTKNDEVEYFFSNTHCKHPVLPTPHNMLQQWKCQRDNAMRVLSQHLKIVDPSYYQSEFKNTLSPVTNETITNVSKPNVVSPAQNGNATEPKVVTSNGRSPHTPPIKGKREKLPSKAISISSYLKEQEKLALAIGANGQEETMLLRPNIYHFLHSPMKERLVFDKLLLAPEALKKHVANGPGMSNDVVYNMIVKEQQQKVRSELKPLSDDLSEMAEPLSQVTFNSHPKSVQRPKTAHRKPLPANAVAFKASVKELVDKSWTLGAKINAAEHENNRAHLLTTLERGGAFVVPTGVSEEDLASASLCSSSPLSLNNKSQKSLPIFNSRSTLFIPQVTTKEPPLQWVTPLTETKGTLLTPMGRNLGDTQTLHKAELVSHTAMVNDRFGSNAHQRTLERATSSPSIRSVKTSVASTGGGNHMLKRAIGTSLQRPQSSFPQLPPKPLTMERHNRPSTASTGQSHQKSFISPYAQPPFRPPSAALAKTLSRQKLM